jgi:hypothetical protein
MYLGVPIINPSAPAYGPLPGYDPTNDCEAIMRATKGIGTDENLCETGLHPTAD